MKKTAPTLHDVAKAAGVSIATVSKYLNGTQRFSPAVEANIDATVKTLGYRSNELARSMITGATKTIGVAILDINNPHFTSVVKGANRVAIDNGYTLLLVDTEENQGREMQLLDALSRRVDGMIISSRMPESDIKTVVDFGKPIVFFGRLESLRLPTVGSDVYRGAYMLTQHLVTQGHRHIAYLGFSKSRWDAERLRGMLDCLQQHDLPLARFDAQLPFASEGERMCSFVMLGRERPDALICYNDLMAIGFMKEAQALGFQIPQDLSVAGFDNIQYGEYVSPSLTSVDLKSQHMGEVAMRKMLDTLAGKETDHYTMLEPQVVLRQSTMKRQ
ncbi:transcriptional regulator, LacI family [Noviherbaspirillum humi]|uniref:Transcriptional regulator, LacI family n=1 Tax=Noviherbaspirillum humi TaxID=1688639 RepID=A0A239C312_9BURK|nr:LacI family DNA-binding transcriptional regulator [Noviherbaspirillum humi]SNS14657.1 transcriptional regulator, LacI family [Noviherbaspirillum humi]